MSKTYRLLSEKATCDRATRVRSATTRCANILVGINQLRSFNASIQLGDHDLSLDLTEITIVARYTHRCDCGCDLDDSSIYWALLRSGLEFQKFIFTYWAKHDRN